jgi:hypothetical protein
MANGFQRIVKAKIALLGKGEFHLNPIATNSIMNSKSIFVLNLIALASCVAKQKKITGHD